MHPDSRVSTHGYAYFYFQLNLLPSYLLCSLGDNLFSNIRNFMKVQQYIIVQHKKQRKVRVNNPKYIQRPLNILWNNHHPSVNLKITLGLPTADAVPVFYRAFFRVCSLQCLLRSLWPQPTTLCLQIELSNFLANFANVN